MKNSKGFTLILALIVLTLLSTLMALFIALVSSNLRQSQGALKVSAIEVLANSGIDYCNTMLMRSPDGADWRPVPDNISMKDGWVPGAAGAAAAPAAPSASDCADDLQKIYESDPDYENLMAWWPEELTTDGGIPYAGPTGGYTRFNSGEGRFLVRVSYESVVPDGEGSYNANYYDADSKFLKIESIGKLGAVDESDPTTMKPYGNPSKQQYLVAYKPIAITDYLRYVTNKDDRKTVFNIGTDLIAEKFGRADTRYSFRGAPMRIQGDAEFDANSTVFLRGQSLDVNGRSVVSPRDYLEITGELVNPDLDFVTLFSCDDSTSQVMADSVSKDSFVKRGGAKNGDGVTRIAAPIIDASDVSGNNLRYRSLTKSSGRYITETGKNSGEFGWGAGIYINNFSDVQKESETLFGGYSLRADWLNPGNLFSKNWQGPYYIPPGVVIVLHPDVSTGITITRTDFDSRNKNKVWCDAGGIPHPEWGATINVPYPLDGENRSFEGGGLPAWADSEQSVIKGNGVIYAEGNIRIKGMLPENVQLTVVSNENIYIEGNLLKYRNADTELDKAVDMIGQSSSPVDHRCSISLLARNNVVVNTTQFLAPQMALGPDDTASDADGSNEPPYHMELSPLNYGRNFSWSYMFGPYESETDLYGSVLEKGYNVMLRHSSKNGFIDAYMDVFNHSVNNWVSVDWGSELNLNPYYRNYAFKNKLRMDGGNSWQTLANGSGWRYAVEYFKLFDNDMYGSGRPTMGDTQYMRIFLDRESVGNYVLGNISVNPMDVRIEALSYAQNGSFFVIPGYWFNPDPNFKNDKLWMLGDPMDIRITIDGAISENVMADKSDQRAWMEKWGTTFDPTLSEESYDSFHDGLGLNILYDDHLAYPVVDAAPIRTDRFGRVLAVTPRLPVSETLVYKGRP